MELKDKIKKKVFDCFDTIFDDLTYMENEKPGWVGYCSRDNDRWRIVLGAKKNSIGVWYWDGPTFMSIKNIFSLSLKEFDICFKEYLKIKKGETRIEILF